MHHFVAILGFFLTAVALLGTYFLSIGRTLYCCRCWFLSNSGLIFFNAYSQNWAMTFLFSAYLFLTYKTYRRYWEEEEKKFEALISARKAESL